MILKNSAKCTACEIEIESTHRHDFNVHYCKVDPTPGMKWEKSLSKEGQTRETLVPSGETTFRFAVDGGKAYIRRVGGGYMDTSVYAAEVIRIPGYE